MKNKKGAVEIHWGQPHISAVPGREERWPSGTPLHVSAAPAASCREGKPLKNGAVEIRWGFIFQNP